MVLDSANLDTAKLGSNLLQVGEPPALDFQTSGLLIDYQKVISLCDAEHQSMFGATQAKFKPQTSV